MSFWKKIKSSFSKSSSKINEGFTRVFQSKKIDEGTLEALEDHLISCDLGVDVALGFIETLKKEKILKTTHDVELAVKKRLAAYLVDMMESMEAPPLLSDTKPSVIMLVGVNGTGKTTTAAKLAHFYTTYHGKRVCFGACDTFRAAAVEQLDVWANRVRVPVYKGKAQADPASVAYDAYTFAKEQQSDILILDTAGRLHNKNTLMEELSKIDRVLKKHHPNLPHQTLLTLDATTGQNALNQTEIFKKATHIHGFILNKLDGTAKGGILVALMQKYKLPAYWVGVGESMDDLKPFNAHGFVENLLDIDTIDE
jgi:fused signal recognition particle receptor